MSVPATPSAEFLAALAAAEAAMPIDPRAAALREESLGEVLSDVNDDDGNTLGSPMRRVKSDAEWEDKVILYSTLDGSPSFALRGMVAKRLQQRWPEDSHVPEHLWGKPAFTRKPLIEYKQGNLPCMLNPDHPQRSFIESLGLGHLTCRKHNFMTEYAVSQHMAHKHSDEDKAIKDGRARAQLARTEATAAENNEILRALLATLAEQRKEASVEPKS